MSFNTPLLVLHLLGLAFGLGASTVLDFRILRLLRGKPVTGHEVALAAALSTFVRGGLALLWLSGLGFLIRAWTIAPDLLANPKLHAKIAIVVALTLNGLLIETIALPLLRRQCGRHLFDGVTNTRQIAVLSIGVVSAMSWYAPFLLGIARELNFGPSAGAILAVYLALIATGIAVMLAGRRMLYRPIGASAAAVRGMQRRPAQTATHATAHSAVHVAAQGG